MGKIYGSWCGNPEGTAEDKIRCIATIYSTHISGRQCERKRGHGPNKAYCKQHNPERIKQVEDAKDKAYDDKYKKLKAQDKRNEILNEMATGLTNSELKKCHIRFKK